MCSIYRWTKLFEFEIRIKRATHSSPTSGNRSFAQCIRNVLQGIKSWKNSQMYSSWQQQKIIFPILSLFLDKGRTIPRASSNLEQESRSPTCFPISNPSSRKIGSQKGLDSRTFHDIVGPRRRGPVTRSLCDPFWYFCWDRLAWWNREWKIYGQILKRIEEEIGGRLWKRWKRISPRSSIFLH